MTATPQDWDAPEWANAYCVHEWKNYISTEVQQIWHSFTDYQKKAIARQAEENAEREEWD